MKLDGSIQVREPGTPIQSQIRSRERVAELGEVFTAQREISLMVDMWQNAAREAGTDLVAATVLEPSCGNCGFLVELLKRKIHELRERTGPGRMPVPRDYLVALSSLYGIDISAENIKEAYRLLDERWQYEIQPFRSPDRQKLSTTGRRIIRTNLIRADFLDPSDTCTLFERKPLDSEDGDRDMLIELTWQLGNVLNPSSPLEAHGARPIAEYIVKWDEAGLQNST